MWAVYLVTKSRENIGFDHRHDVLLLELTKVENPVASAGQVLLRKPQGHGLDQQPLLFPRTLGLSTVYSVLIMT